MMNAASMIKRRKRSGKLHPSKAFIIRTQHPLLEARKENAADEALRDRVTALEHAGDDWHPTGHSWWTPVKILLGGFHHAYRNTHAYLQPERQEAIVDMIESYLSMLTLFYSLVGVAAVEMSMSPAYLSENATEDSTETILIGISRFGWFALGPICLTAVAAAIHVLWSIQAVPVHQRRKHVLNNQVFYSMPYACAPTTFLLLHVSIFSGYAASVVRTPSAWMRNAEVCGMVIGFLPVVPLVYASGSMIEDAFRPWEKGYAMGKEQVPQEETSNDEEEFTPLPPAHDRDATRYCERRTTSSETSSTVLPGGHVIDREPPSCEELRYHLHHMGLDFCLELIELEGLTWAMMRNIIKTTGSFMLLDRMMESAGVAKAGHRAAIALRLQEDIDNPTIREAFAGQSGAADSTDALAVEHAADRVSGTVRALDPDELDLDALAAKLATDT